MRHGIKSLTEVKYSHVGTVSGVECVSPVFNSKHLHSTGYQKNPAQESMTHAQET